MRRVLLVSAFFLVALAAPSGAGAATTCPTFEVVHDDHIGRLALPAGNDDVAVTGLSCPASTQLLAEFLQDYDGDLPRPWGYTVRGAGRGAFRNSRSGASFTVARSGGGGGGGGGNGGDLTCSGLVRVGADDRIGPLLVSRGSYEVVRLTPRISCTRARSLLGQFLQDFDGDLPGGWVLLPQSGAFVNGSLSYGLRIKRTGGGGGRGTRCPATFRVLHADRVGALRLPAGPYWVYVRGLSCSASTRLFAAFLARPTGDLPRPGRVQPATGAFVRGSGPTSFRVKPAFRVA